MDAATQLRSFLDKYSQEVAADARHALAFLEGRLPTAARLVYDNYNALVVGFASGEKASDAFMSIALYPQYVRLFFLHALRPIEPVGAEIAHGLRVPPAANRMDARRNDLLCGEQRRTGEHQDRRDSGEAGLFVHRIEVPL